MKLIDEEQRSIATMLVEMATVDAPQQQRSGLHPQHGAAGSKKTAASSSGAYDCCDDDDTTTTSATTMTSNNDSNNDNNIMLMKSRLDSDHIALANNVIRHDSNSTPVVHGGMGSMSMSSSSSAAAAAAAAAAVNKDNKDMITGYAAAAAVEVSPRSIGDVHCGHKDRSTAAVATNTPPDDMPSIHHQRQQQHPRQHPRQPRRHPLLVQDDDDDGSDYTIPGNSNSNNGISVHTIFSHARADMMERDVPAILCSLARADSEDVMTTSSTVTLDSQQQQQQQQQLWASPSTETMASTMTTPSPPAARMKKKKQGARNNKASKPPPKKRTFMTPITKMTGTQKQKKHGGAGVRQHPLLGSPLYSAAETATGERVDHNRDSAVVDIILTPAPLDILCGRGNGVYPYPGNVRFREIVQGAKPAYRAAPRAEKRGMVRQVVDSLRPGRFLERVGGTGTGAGWTIMPYDRVCIKTSQALREQDTKG